MKIIKPSVEIMTPLDGGEILRHLERCGRVCYKSEANIAPGSAERFVQALIRRGHESVLEHYSFTVKFICDRGVTHEIVRHRIASYSQESTRYCNYSGEMTFIWPCYLEEGTDDADVFLDACEDAEMSYDIMIRNGRTPQEARAVLPNSLKTELVMTANLREWRHFLKLRTSKAAHPQIREVSTMLLNKLKKEIQIVFDDIEPEA